MRTHHDLTAHLRHLLTIPADHQLPGELLVFADFVDEVMRDERRAGAVRKVASRGPVDVPLLTAPAMMKSDEVAREMLHRLRVQCLILFRTELPERFDAGSPPPGMHAQSIFKVDPRWPSLTCAICDVNMIRCGQCAAEWCAAEERTVRCPECGYRPSTMYGRGGTVTVGGQVLEITDWRVDGTSPYS